MEKKDGKKKEFLAETMRGEPIDFYEVR